MAVRGCRLAQAAATEANNEGRKAEATPLNRLQPWHYTSILSSHFTTKFANIREEA